MKLEHRLRSVLLIYEQQVKFVIARHCSPQIFNIFLFRILDADTLSTIREFYLPGLMFVFIFPIVLPITDLFQNQRGLAAKRNRGHDCQCKRRDPYLEF